MERAARKTFSKFFPAKKQSSPSQSLPLLPEPLYLRSARVTDAVCPPKPSPVEYEMNQSSSCSRFGTFTVAAVVIQLVGLALFVFGFFPIKPALSGISGPESFRAPWDDAGENQSVSGLPPDELRRLYEEFSEIPSPFDRLVLMVIDGLPAEFVLGKDSKPPKRAFLEAMPYTQSLLSSGGAIGFHAKAAPPTVTMPRLKAMVSGAIPGYLDVVYNFNTQALQDDNIIGQLFQTGREILMFGDNTWLKLFPGLFTRADGVGSFFVKDTVEVDQNVSRHLGDELIRDDWNIMILHYLGLDHVGHTGGRNSILMGPKLKEMDEVIEMIHSAIKTQDKDQGHTLLVIVSDHGMTEDGNHGGSSYEETDCLALFIGLKDQMHGFTGAQGLTVDQVDIAPTLAALFNVPIPKNNIGVLIQETLQVLPEDQQLRAMELNSWQLLRLLQAQLSGLKCSNFNEELDVSKCSGSKEKFCCLYHRAAALHRSWKLKKMSNTTEDYSNTLAAYHEFLKTTSEWLSRRVTDKPLGLLVLGVSAMLSSSGILLGLLFHLYKAVRLKGGSKLPKIESSSQSLGVDEAFIIAATLGNAVSMISSSMVEEEQYNWHFLTSTHCLLLLRETVQALSAVKVQSSSRNPRTGCRVYFLVVLLISGRILRGWHQGGINWTNLPDISKWLELRGNDYVKYTQIAACLLVMSLSLFALSLLWKRTKGVSAIMLSLLLPGFLVLKHVIEYQDGTGTSSGIDATLSAQTIYCILLIIFVGISVASPWFILSRKKTFYSSSSSSSTSFSSNTIMKVWLHDIRDSLYVIGWTQLICWCLVQLLLQQPVNSMPVLLLLLQIYFMMLYSTGGPPNKQWVEVSTLYYLGMVGHYAMGNSNSLATIDVGGAFIGTSSYSTLFSGILMFMITYASPMLYLLSMSVHISVRDVDYALVGTDPRKLLMAMLGFPCLVPLALNSIALTAYTIVLLLMQNHLFVWSVFSPKFLYVAAMTICIDAGVFIVAATVIYTHSVVVYRRKFKNQ